MNQIIKEVSSSYPELKIQSGDSFYWSPESKLIVYNKQMVNKDIGLWAFFHEVAHAKLNHNSYSSDLGLLKLEVEAWDEAKKIAIEYGLKIDEDHIQDCLDTYRDWLYRRSTCPTCEIVCLQITPTSYRCHNCSTVWSVSASRFCRPYRMTNKEIKEKRLQNIATFS